MTKYEQTDLQKMLIIAAYAIESEYPTPTPAQNIADYTRNDIARTIARAFRQAGGLRTQEPIPACTACDKPLFPITPRVQVLIENAEPRLYHVACWTSLEGS